MLSDIRNVQRSAAPPPSHTPPLRSSRNRPYCVETSGPSNTSCFLMSGARWLEWAGISRAWGVLSESQQRLSNGSIIDPLPGHLKSSLFQRLLRLCPQNVVRTSEAFTTKPFPELSVAGPTKHEWLTPWAAQLLVSRHVRCPWRIKSIHLLDQSH